MPRVEILDYETGLPLEAAEKIKQKIRMLEEENARLREENMRLRDRITLLEIMLDEVNQRNMQLDEKIRQLAEKTALTIAELKTRS